MGIERPGQSHTAGSSSRVATCLAVLLFSGCSSPSTSNGQLTTEEQAIRNVGLAYRDASRALRRGPTSVKELQPYLKKYGNPEKLLTSPSDGQPYHIVWGIVPSQPSKGGQSNRFLAYEQTGKNGKRYALDFMLKVHHLNDEEFNRLRAPG